MNNTELNNALVTIMCELVKERFASRDPQTNFEEIFEYFSKDERQSENVSKISEADLPF